MGTSTYVTRIHITPTGARIIATHDVQNHRLISRRMLMLAFLSLHDEWRITSLFSAVRRAKHVQLDSRVLAVDLEYLEEHDLVRVAR